MGFVALCPKEGLALSERKHVHKAYQTASEDSIGGEVEGTES